MDRGKDRESDCRRTNLVEIQLVLQQRPQRHIQRLVRRRQFPVQIFRQSIHHQLLTDQSRVRNSLRVGTAVLGDDEIGDFPTRSLVRRTMLGRVGEPAKAKAGLELGDEGGPGVCSRAWETAIEGEGWLSHFCGHHFHCVAIFHNAPIKKIKRSCCFTIAFFLVEFGLQGPRMSTSCIPSLSLDPHAPTPRDPQNYNTYPTTKDQKNITSDRILKNPLG